MPSTCHWIPSAALPTEWPHSTIATGAAVMRKLMRPKDTMPAATAIAKPGCHTMTSKGRPPDLGAPAANGAGLRKATTTIVRRASAACARKVPVNIRPGTSSRVQITVWGPMIAAASPPHITQEIARALKATEAASVAAKR
jgi:hypothetical protein